VNDPAERPQHLDLRASDADRERVAKVLHDAMGEGRLTIDELDERLRSVYQAKTLGDLVPMTADLPKASSPSPLPSPLADALPSERVGGVPTSSGAFAMMSGFDRSGPWVVPRQFTAGAFLGGGELDLTEATFAEHECTINVFAFMGGVEIIVPDDITVRVTGFAIMGGFDHKYARQGPPGSPVLTVTGFAFMGGVDVRPPKRKHGRARLEN
jgi:hypothetical protein